MQLRGVNQKTLARALGCSNSTITRRLDGERPWRVEDLDALAAHFGVPLAALLVPPAVDELAQRRRRERAVICGSLNARRVASGRVAA